MSSNELFDESYQRLFGDQVGISAQADPFFETFYRNFLVDPDIADAFSGVDMTRQVSMLRKSFFNLVAFYVSCEPSAELTRIALLHRNLSIAGHFYELWLDALITAVRQHDPEADLATELAWRWAMAPGLTYMRLVGDLPRITEAEDK